MIKVFTKDERYAPMVFVPIGNPFVEKFLVKLADSASKYRIRDWNERIPYIRNIDYTTWRRTQRDVRKSFIATIDRINELGYRFPIGTDDIRLEQDLETQLFLNMMHRCFTTAHRSSTEAQQTYDDVNFFEVEREHIEEFRTLVHAINDGVHAIENFITTDRMREFPAQHEYQIEFDAFDPYDANNVAKEYFVDLTEEDYNYFSDNLDYDLWLPWHQIQGKCYWDAYFAYDDPTQWDISEHKQYSGSIAIGSRQQARDPKLETWLQEHGVTPGPMTCGLPIAKLVEGRETLDWLYTQPGGPINLIKEVTCSM